jgi:hypothetical protein
MQEQVDKQREVQGSEEKEEAVEEEEGEEEEEEEAVEEDEAEDEGTEDTEEYDEDKVVVSLLERNRRCIRKWLRDEYVDAERRHNDAVERVAAASRAADDSIDALRVTIQRASNNDVSTLPDARAAGVVARRNLSRARAHRNSAWFWMQLISSLWSMKNPGVANGDEPTRRRVVA